MKKVCFVVLIMLLFVSTGCQSSNKVPKEPISPPSSYSAKLEAVFNETKINALFTKHSDTKYEIKILSPEILQPLMLVYENGVCTVTYEGMTFETDSKRFAQAEFGALLIQALTDISDNIVTENFNADGTVTYKGPSDYGDFVFIMDSETGLWKEFSIEGALLHVTFSDYEILNKG